MGVNLLVGPGMLGLYIGRVALGMIRGLFQVDGVASFDAAFWDADFVAPAVVVVGLVERN